MMCKQLFECVLNIYTYIVTYILYLSDSLSYKLKYHIMKK